jgi:predicted ATPase
MKLLQIDIQGYRSLNDISWSPGNLNVIIGPNGSGKSNLLRGMELLAASAQGRLSQQVLRDGGMGALLWDGQADQIVFHLAANLAEPEQSSAARKIDYRLQLSQIGKSSSYRIDEEILDDGSARTKRRPHKLIERQQNTGQVYDGPKSASRYLENLSETESLLSEIGSPFASPTLEALFRDRLAGWQFYQDFLTHRDAPVRQAPIARYETAVSADGSNLIQVLHTLYSGGRDFKHDLDQAMRAAFSDEFEELTFPPAADQRIQMRLRWKSLQRGQTAADLSDGALRFLYLITILANPEPPSLIAIDEPETGLHPSMLPIIAEFAAESALKTQLIFTTHSAEFLNAFKHPPVTTVAHWENGKTTLQTPSAEALQYWLKEYSLGKLYLSGELEGME